MSGITRFSRHTVLSPSGNCHRHRPEELSTAFYSSVTAILACFLPSVLTWLTPVGPEQPSQNV